jgi:MSHA pilin protein MshC
MRGFTMIELIVVMLVAALLSAIAAPRLTQRSALQERAARDQLRALLNHGRKVAMTQQRDVCLLTTPNQARAVYVAAGACAPALPLAAPGGGAYVIDMPAGVVLGGAALVRFNARGQPVPAANQVLLVGVLTLTVNRETGLAI